jgi:hypothetical protein
MPAARRSPFASPQRVTRGARAAHNHQVHTVVIPNPQWAAQAWADAHPDDLNPACCWGSLYDAAKCTCWSPVYDTTQAPPQTVTSPELLTAQKRMCHDCAYRPGSPERADEYLAEQLHTLPDAGTPFWCHEGMRRPAYWQHPDGRRVDAHPDDWHPAREGNFVYQADGSPALLCNGWMYRRLNTCRPQSPAVT